MVAYATYFYSPYSKKYEWSYIHKDLAVCENRYNEKNDKGLIVKVKKAYFKPVLTLEELKRDYTVIRER
jgi:hypothetical protein